MLRDRDRILYAILYWQATHFKLSAVAAEYSILSVPHFQGKLGADRRLVEVNDLEGADHVREPAHFLHVPEKHGERVSDLNT